MDGALEAALENRRIDFAQLTLGLFILDADDDAVGMEEIADGSSFTQEFGIGSDAEFGSAAIDVEDAGQLLAGLRRNSTLLDDQLGSARSGGDLLGNVIDGGKVSVSRFQGRRSDADEDGI